MHSLPLEQIVEPIWIRFKTYKILPDMRQARYSGKLFKSTHKEGPRANKGSLVLLDMR
jgi:hypothetical protein